MGSEYIRLSNTERVYGEKNLLQAQLEILSIIKRSQAYTKLRKEELVLRIVLKNKIAEILNLLMLLDKILPKTKVVKKNEKGESEIIFDKERFTLEQEIDKIRAKLESLQNSY